MTLDNDTGTDGRTDGQTDRQTDGQTECDAICGPLLGRRPHNNNTNNHDIYSLVIMAEVIARVHSVHLTNVEQCQAAADPQTKPPDLGLESACFRQLSSTNTIAIYYYYYYSARKLLW